jgi:hypothetical protein
MRAFRMRRKNCWKVCAVGVLWTRTWLRNKSIFLRLSMHVFASTELFTLRPWSLLTKSWWPVRTFV